MDKLIGTVLDGRYTIKEVLGIGGMSIVYRAEDSVGDRDVAVKVLKDEFVGEQKFRHRFLNESRAIAMLSQKNIVDVVDVNFEGPVQYIVMELISGKTLKEYIEEKGVIPVDEAVGYCKQVLAALEHAHAHGVVHRDIKPQNIMLLDDGTIKVTDFGIAHVSSGETVTMNEIAIGSVHYISPEQARGHLTDEKSDLYSTGIVLYEMVTGKVPFESETAVSVALMQVQNDPPHPSECNPDLPKAIDQIIMRAMKKDPEKRYRHASEMMADLEKYEQDHSVVFDYEDTAKPDDATVCIPAVGKDDMRKKRDKSRRLRRAIAANRVLAVLLGILFAGGLIFGGWRAMAYYAEHLTGEFVEVPNVKGQNLETVLSLYAQDKNFSFEYEFENNTEPYGTILTQSEEAGNAISADKTLTIKLKVSEGPKTTVVPSVVGLSLPDAKVKLTQSSLTYELEYRVDSTKTKDTVLSCTPEAGSTVNAKSSVTLVVSVQSVSTTVSVPNVVGKTNAEASQILTSLGLTVSRKLVYSDTYALGYVTSQSPEYRKKIAPGAAVTLYISQGPYQKDPEPTTSDGEETSSSGDEQPTESDGSETGSDGAETGSGGAEA